MEDQPTDQYLQNISDDMKHEEWRRVGRLLGLEDPELDTVECDYEHNGCREIRFQMLKTWQCKLGSQATTYALDHALQEIKTKSNTLDSLNSPYREIASHLQTLMIEDYSSLQLPRVSWYLGKNMDIKELYVDLSLNITDSKREIAKTNIRIQEIFDDINSSDNFKRILIEGGAGYGKTTLICKLVSDWADGEHYIRSRFLLVFVVLLRHFRGNLKENLLDQFDIDEFEKSEVLETVLSIAQKTLLILDGFDELNDASKQALMKTLKKKGFRDLNVIITSRTAEMFPEKMEKKDSLSAIGAKTKTSVVLSFWNKSIKIEGIAEEKRKEYLGKYLNIDPEKITREFSYIVDTSAKLFECPLFLFLLATIVEEENVGNVTTTAELYMKFFNFLIKKTYENENDFDITDKTINVFDPQNSDSICDRLLLLEFGELTWRKMHENYQCSFTEKEILRQCADGKKILRYGFLTKNTLYCKRQFEFSYEPIHKTFLEFLACFFLSSQEQLLEEHKNYFIVRHTILGPDSLHLRFTVRLLAERAHILLTILSQYAGLFSVNFVLDLYSELEETEENERAYIPFVLPLWVVDSQSIASASYPQIYLEKVKNLIPKQYSLLQLASENSIIDVYEWRFPNPECFPYGFHVPVLKLQHFFYTEEYYKEVEKRRISCDELICNCSPLPANKDGWKGFLKFISCIKYKYLSFDEKFFEDNLFTDEIIPFFVDELTVGEWKDIKIKRLVITRLSGEMLYILTECLMYNRVQEVYSTIGFGFDFNLVQLACRSQYLTSCYLSDIHDVCNKSEIELELSDLFRKEKTWEYLYVDKKLLLIDRNNVKSKSLKVESIKFSHERNESLKIDCKVLSLCTGIRSISISVTLFSFLKDNLPFGWSGFTSIKEIELGINCKINQNILQLLLQFKSLQILTITFNHPYQMEDPSRDSDDDRIRIPSKDMNLLVKMLRMLSFDTLNFKILSDGFLPFLKYILKRLNDPHTISGEPTGDCDHDNLEGNGSQSLVKFHNLRVYRLHRPFRILMYTNHSLEVIIHLSLQLLEKKQLKNFYFNYILSDLDIFHCNMKTYSNRFIFRKKSIKRSDGFFTQHRNYYENPTPEELWITRLEDVEIKQKMNEVEPVFIYTSVIFKCLNTKLP